MGRPEEVTQGGNGDGSEPESLWSVRDTAKYLNVSEKTVYRQARLGIIPCSRLGGLLRFHPARVRAYASQSQGGAQVIPLRGR